LIKAYNALKASAIVAGIAQTFALNPLLGLGATAVAAGILAGANALANKDNANVAELGVPKNVAGTDFGTYVPPEFKVDQYKGQSFMGTLPKAGKAGTASKEVVGAGSEEALRKRLEQIAVQMTELVFRMNTGGISMPKAEAELAILKAEFAVLQKQNEAIKAQNPINITVNGAIDKEGTARSIVDVLNNSLYRGGGGGANALVTP